MRRTALIALVSLGLLAVPLPASAAPVSAPYECTSPLGAQSVTITATLTATPNPATVGSPVTFDLEVSDLGLTAPLTVSSWSGTVDLDVSGAETAQFTLTGTGGPIPANQPITGTLTGTWTPTAAGTDEITGGDVTITAQVVLLGSISLTCTPVDPRPVGETLTVS
ncbi:hypothetical protein [Paractinoplanes rishiriensis]|uniref:Uncharacterized protein n=1 Tax=Paractinoplanes rishiriensis TaxID=1050105 RepID=A0A919MWM9_9ACTN|nr:hypothetical protein [Actinoplanes rishiriensis]GIE97629.1 hypothetical protein Ari01nite_50940 [Actinoplanes rishiriensis]